MGTRELFLPCSSGSISPSFAGKLMKAACVPPRVLIWSQHPKLQKLGHAVHICAEFEACRISHYPPFPQQIQALRICEP